MRLLWIACSSSLVATTAAFSVGSTSSILQRPTRTTTTIPSTRRWTLKEPADADVETIENKDDNISVEVAQQQEVDSQQEEEEQEEEEQVADVSPEVLTPSQDEEELTRDEQFMRMAIELAEEEYVAIFVGS